MTPVEVSSIAVEDLDRLVITHSLPSDTKARVKRSLRILERFPRVGRELDGRWSNYRFILGPWRWMLILYVYDLPRDVVVVVSIQDARSSMAATFQQ